MSLNSLKGTQMANKQDTKQDTKETLPPSIGIRRIDNLTFELYEIKDNATRTILKETFSIVMNRAEAILRQLAEGTHNG